MDQEVTRPLATPSNRFCSQCGASTPLAANFCLGCGAAVGQNGTPLGSQGDRVLQVGEQQDSSVNEMSLGTAWGCYTAAVVFLAVLVALRLDRFAILMYWVAGFCMTRLVMRRLVKFHPLYSTVANVFSAKIWMFFLWPINMLILLIKLSVNAAL